MGIGGDNNEEIMKSTIPVIDLQDFPSQSQKLVEACEEWGCFRLVNHGVPLTLMSDMKSTVRSLLDLPIEIKRRNKGTVAGTGYVSPHDVNPLYESLSLHDAASPDSVHAFSAQLTASPHQSSNIYSPRVISGVFLEYNKASKLRDAMGSENLQYMPGLVQSLYIYMCTGLFSCRWFLCCGGLLTIECRRQCT